MRRCLVAIALLGSGCATTVRHAASIPFPENRSACVQNCQGLLTAPPATESSAIHGAPMTYVPCLVSCGVSVQSGYCPTPGHTPRCFDVEPNSVAHPTSVRMPVRLWDGVERCNATLPGGLPAAGPIRDAPENYLTCLRDTGVPVSDAACPIEAPTQTTCVNVDASDHSTTTSVVSIVLGVLVVGACVAGWVALKGSN
jgi:hypothetical protein